MSLLGNLRDLIGDLPEEDRSCPPPEPPPATVSARHQERAGRTCRARRVPRARSTAASSVA